jgi:hypothetical protein
MTFCSYSGVTKPVAYHFITEHYFTLIRITNKQCAYKSVVVLDAKILKFFGDVSKTELNIRPSSIINPGYKLRAQSSLNCISSH